MAIIYSYPSAAPQTGDYVIGTQYDQELEKNRTVQFQVGQMVNFCLLYTSPSPRDRG